MTTKMSELIDLQRGFQKKRIFWDEEIYQLELEKIFARSWLFLTHESEIPNPGDFFCTFMGEDPVIVVRTRSGELRAFLNTCSHRGNQVCYAESGNTRAFTCSYHGWSYYLDGTLAAVPLEAEAYHNLIDKSKLGLRPVAKVESFAGFVFGCFDPQAPSLRDYLGEMAWYLETFTARSGAELLGPPLKSVLHCNWKVPVENFICDSYHVGWTHAAALKVLGGPLAGAVGNTQIPPDSGVEISTRYGHGFGVIWDAATALHRGSSFEEFLRAHQSEVAALLGEMRARLYRAHWDASLFPNCSFLYGTNVWKVWHPRGPHECEVWTWTLVEKDMPSELKRKVQKEALRTFGTAGTLESDDAQNLHGCTATNRGMVTRRGEMCGMMGIDREAAHPQLPGLVGDNNWSEIALRGFYRFFAEMTESHDWPEIIARTQAMAGSEADAPSRPQLAPEPGTSRA
jgi:naphthalene 1,2-dioxygenase subunit alpha